jgi:hypothetical protein
VAFYFVKKLGKLYQFVNVLSLDVVAGAIVSALFFAQVFAVQISLWGVGVLGLTVWIIYTTDHLADANRVGAAASSRRHRFHQKHFIVLAGVLLFAVLVDGVLISFIRKPVLHSGLALAAVVIIYLLLQRSLKYVKEFCGALLYSGGVLLPAWSLSPETLSLAQGLFVAEFCITVLSNLLLFSLFDHHRDLRDHHQSFATVMGNGILMLLQFIWLANAQGTLLAILVMNVLLLIIFVFHKPFETGDRYRLVGDAVFLVPLFFFVL